MDARNAGLEQSRRANIRTGEDESFSSRATRSPSQSVHGGAPRKRKRKESGSSVPSVNTMPSR
jgi:hypothetical protein